MLAGDDVVDMEGRGVEAARHVAIFAAQMRADANFEIKGVGQLLLRAGAFLRQAGFGLQQSQEVGYVAVA